jgi:hypothetical protein
MLTHNHTYLGTKIIPDILNIDITIDHRDSIGTAEEKPDLSRNVECEKMCVEKTGTDRATFQ